MLFRVGDPNSKIISLLTHNCNFATVMNYDVNTCFLMVLGESCEKVIWSPKEVTTPRLRTVDLAERIAQIVSDLAGNGGYTSTNEYFRVVWEEGVIPPEKLMVFSSPQVSCFPWWWYCMSSGSRQWLTWKATEPWGWETAGNSPLPSCTAGRFFWPPLAYSSLCSLGCSF